MHLVSNQSSLSPPGHPWLCKSKHRHGPKRQLEPLWSDRLERSDQRAQTLIEARELKTPTLFPMRLLYEVKITTKRRRRLSWLAPLGVSIRDKESIARRLEFRLISALKWALPIRHSSNGGTCSGQFEEEEEVRVGTE